MSERYNNVYEGKLIVSSHVNGLANGLSAIGLVNNTPVFNYGSMALIDSGAMYRNRKWQFSYDFLKLARILVESDEYEFFAIAVPTNNNQSEVAWKDTFRTQFYIPEGSYLISISGCAS